MMELREFFAAYGADYDATMGRFLGNEQMYARFLDMFFDDENLQKLGDALAAGDLTAAFEAAHTLKGVAGNLGLTPLYQAVCGIVEPLRGREARDYGEMYQAIRSDFERIRTLRGQQKGEG